MQIAMSLRTRSVRERTNSVHQADRRTSNNAIREPMLLPRALFMELTMSASDPNGRRRVRSYIRDDTSTVMWAIIALVAVFALGALYFYWDTGADVAISTSPPSQTTQSSPSSNTGSGGSPSATPGNQSTTGTTPAR
jgi:hypothetical protein